MEKVCLDRRLNQHNIPLSQKPNPEQGTKSIHFRKSETEASKLQRRIGWFMRLKERSPSHNTEAQDEAASADVDAEASYSEALPQINNEGGCTKW